MQTIHTLLNQVDKRQDELLALIKSLIEFETPSPPARNTKENQVIANSVGFFN